MISVVGQICGVYPEIKKFRIRVYHIHGCPDAYIASNPDLDNKSRVEDKDLPLYSYDLGLEDTCTLGDFVHLLCPTGCFDDSARVIGKVWGTSDLSDELKGLISSFSSIPTPAEEQEIIDNGESKTCGTGSGVAGSTSRSAEYDAQFEDFFGYPLPYYVNIASEWYAKDQWHQSPHRGIDLCVGIGTDVYAAGDGTVCAVSSPYAPNTSGINPQISSSDMTSYGNYVTIDHGTLPDGNHYYTHYAHLKAVCVSNGQRVFGTQNGNIGTKIGEVDNTGNSFGDHLHFEVLVHNAPWGLSHSIDSTRNPRVYIKFNQPN